MRILALSPWWPFPADNGQRMRIASLLQALATRHEVHLVAMSQEPVGPEQIRAAESLCASVREAAQRTWTPRRFEQVASLWSAEPASVRATWDPVFAELTRSRAADVRPDIVVALSLKAAPYALEIHGLPRLLEELEITNILEQYRSASAHRRPRAWLTWIKHQAYVKRLLASFDACTVVSERERTIVRSIAPAGMAIEVLPNGALIDPLATAPALQPDTLIYPGALSYSANLDAMRFFISHILPRIRAERPQVRLRITGKTTDEQGAALPSLDGVELTGYMPDIRTAIAQSWCEIVPLRQGGGTRLKILEALALGTPVVSTSKGAEGLELEHGRHILIADTPAAFAHTTLRLLGDSDLRAQLADAGRAAVQERYDWRAIGSRLLELVENLSTARKTQQEPYAA